MCIKMIAKYPPKNQDQLLLTNGSTDLRCKQRLILYVGDCVDVVVAASPVSLAQLASVNDAASANLHRTPWFEGTKNTRHQGGIFVCKHIEISRQIQSINTALLAPSQLVKSEQCVMKLFQLLHIYPILPTSFNPSVLTQQYSIGKSPCIEGATSWF